MKNFDKFDLIWYIMLTFQLVSALAVMMLVIFMVANIEEIWQLILTGIRQISDAVREQ